MNIPHKQLFDFLDKEFPLMYQEEYDNSGRQIAFDESNITGILIAMDVAPQIIDEAIEKKCNCIITHHPMFFRSLKNITISSVHGLMTIRLIQSTISVYAVHTNLDALCWDILAKTIRLTDIKMLFPDKRFNGIGFGAIGCMPDEILLSQFIEQLQHELKTMAIIHYGNLGKKIKTIAAFNGSGSKKISAIIQSYPVNCIVTGDVGYHDAVYANNHDVAVIDIGHYNSEKPLLHFLHSKLYNYLTNAMHCNDVRLIISEKEQNPMHCGVQNGK